MADIAVAVGPGGRHEDGDVIDAFNQARIARVFPGQTTWQFSEQEKKSYLLLQLDDFDDVTRDDMVAPEVGQAGEIVRERRHQVRWRALLATLGTSQQEILDPGTVKDYRAVRLSRAVVERKS